jgi:hypothetical protein
MRDIDHADGFMFGAMCPFLCRRIAELWLLLAAGMLAFFMRDVDEIERFAVYRAMRPYIPSFWAIFSLFSALGILAQLTCDVDIPFPLTVFRATRRFPPFRAKLCIFLNSFGFAFTAICHIIDPGMIIDDLRLLKGTFFLY